MKVVSDKFSFYLFSFWDHVCFAGNAGGPPSSKSYWKKPPPPPVYIDEISYFSGDCTAIRNYIIYKYIKKKKTSI
jgi:hypothetical protein